MIRDAARRALVTLADGPHQVLMALAEAARENDPTG
jgi:hypothetical protein